MIKALTTRYASTFKYVYLLVFFMLLSGLFQPFISGVGGDKLVAGVLILSLGLVGAVLLWKSAYDKNNRISYMALGFGVLGASLYLITLM